MRYIYYIIVLVILFSGLAVYGMFNPSIEVSKPFISVNDRIISEGEFDRMLKRKPGHMTNEQFIESTIEKQLLIQEAVKLQINKEESFRQSVENFYEQSLIKILFDRKLDSLVVDVTDDELEKYEIYLGNKLVITKTSYPSLEDAENRRNGSKETIESDFIDLSDDLKFLVLGLEISSLSAPQATPFGYITYRLDEMMKTKTEDAVKPFDIKKVSIFLQDKKKEQLMEAWTRSIRETAQIWRKK